MSRFHLGDFRDRARDFARSNHSSRRLVLPISRPTTVSTTPRKYPESPGSSRTAHGAAHGTSRRPAPTMLMGRFGPGNPFSAGLNRRCITCPASFRHLYFVSVLDSARRVRGAVLILVAGRARGGAFVPRCFARRRVPIGVSKKNALMEGQERALKPMIRRPCRYSDEP